MQHAYCLKLRRLMGCLQKANEISLSGRTTPILGSMGTAKMTGYEVIVHTDPEASLFFFFLRHAKNMVKSI